MKPNCDVARWSPAPPPLASFSLLLYPAGSRFTVDPAFPTLSNAVVQALVVEAQREFRSRESIHHLAAEAVQLPWKVGPELELPNLM